MTDNDEDQQLMLRYQRGDAQAFDLLYARHKGPLYRYCLRQALDNGTIVIHPFSAVLAEGINLSGYVILIQVSYTIGF